MNIKFGFTKAEVKEIIKTLNSIREGEQGYPIKFQYPDYGGLPENTYIKFTQNQVDYLSGLIYFPLPIEETYVMESLLRGADMNQFEW